jgi:hypothetical protein
LSLQISQLSLSYMVLFEALEAILFLVEGSCWTNVTFCCWEPLSDLFQNDLNPLDSEPGDDVALFAEPGTEPGLSLILCV